MAPYPVETGRLIGRQFGNIGGAVTNVANDVGGHVTDAATTAGGAITDAATTAGDAVTNAAETAGGVVQDAAETVAAGVKTGVEAIKDAAEAIGQLAKWYEQIQALLEAWEKYKSQIYAAAIAAITLIIIMALISCYTCFRCCYECCCRHDDHDHHDQKGALWGICGGPVRERKKDGTREPISKEDPPPIVPPPRDDFCGLKMDRSFLARGMGKRPIYEGEAWNMWGRIGPKGHGSWFNVQREKDWFKWLFGGREKRQGWGDLAFKAESRGKGRTPKREDWDAETALDVDLDEGHGSTGKNGRFEKPKPENTRRFREDF